MPKPTLVVTTLVKAKSIPEFVGSAITSDGERLFVNGTHDLLRGENGAKPKKVNLGMKGSLSDFGGSIPSAGAPLPSRASHTRKKHVGSNFTASGVHRNAVVLTGSCQDVVTVSFGDAAVESKPVPAKAKKAAKPTGYVARGQFQKDLEALVGPLKTRKKVQTIPADTLAEIDALPPEVCAEVTALASLYATYKVPELAGLRTSGFVSIPAQYDLDAEGVRAEEWFTAKKDIDLVMSSVEIYNDQGSPFVIVGKAGVTLFYEDPHGYVTVSKDLEAFLRALLAVEAVKRGKSTAAAARNILAKNVRKHAGKAGYANFFLRTLGEEID